MNASHPDYRQIASSLSYRTKAWIDNEYVDAADGETFATVDPATGAHLADVAAGKAVDVDRAVASARAAFERGDWSEASPSERKRVLQRFADLVDENLVELSVMESLDSGKPLSDALGTDIPEVAACMRWHAEVIDKRYDQIAPTGRDIVGMIVREPIGVVGTVLPWNFPLLMLAWKLGPALATGNSVVLKPAELTPLTALRMGELAAEAGLPAGVLNIVPGLGETAGQAIGRHNDIDCVSFTGSTEVGRYFLRYAAESNMKRIILECGGKSPCVVVGPTADLSNLASNVAAGYLWNQGENCSAGSRLIVTENMYDAVIEAVLAESANWKVGDPFDLDVRVGAMIEPEHFTKVMGYIDGARAEGAEVLMGGARADVGLDGYFVPPTVLGNVTNNMTCAQEEIFGPVLSVIRVKDADEAIRVANDTSYGLASSLWTDDLSTAHRLSRKLRAGTVSVNCFSEGDNSAPFGGFKQSGFGGRDKGVHSHDQYVETKTIWMAV